MLRFECEGGIVFITELESCRFKFVSHNPVLVISIVETLHAVRLRSFDENIDGGIGEP